MFGYVYSVPVRFKHQELRGHGVRRGQRVGLVTNEYEQLARQELARWQKKMTRSPGVIDSTTRRLQQRVNAWIPEQLHSALTTAVRQMVGGVLTRSNLIATAPLLDAPLDEREARVREKIERYRRTAAIEGGVTGAGGVLLGLADFPLLLGIKLNLLVEIAALYGHACSDVRERVYLLHILQLAFSSDAHRAQVYQHLLAWPASVGDGARALDDLDWRLLQQEYRDYLDLAKLAQLMPVIGAPVGVFVNNRLLRKLGDTAMNAHRLRWFASPAASSQAR